MRNKQPDIRLGKRSETPSTPCRLETALQPVGSCSVHTNSVSVSLLCLIVVCVCVIVHHFVCVLCSFNANVSFVLSVRPPLMGFFIVNGDLPLLLCHWCKCHSCFVCFKIKGSCQQKAMLLHERDPERCSIHKHTWTGGVFGPHSKKHSPLGVCRPAVTKSWVAYPKKMKGKNYHNYLHRTSICFFFFIHDGGGAVICRQRLPPFSWAIGSPCLSYLTVQFH